MKALLWKEYRELRPMLLVWLLALVGLHALCQIDAFSRRFANTFPAVFPLTSMLAAIALGSELFSRERQSKTIDYLLARPVSIGRIVWAKFIAGTAGLFLFVGSLLAFVYLLRGTNYLAFSLAETTQRVAYPLLLLIQFPFFWFVYSVALLFSAVLNRTQALVAASLSLFGIFSIATSLQARWPLFEASLWLRVLDDTGAAMTLARNPVLSFVSAGVYGALVFLSVTLAANLFPGRSRRRLVWPAIVAGAGFVFFVIPPAARAVLGEIPWATPIGVYSLGSETGSAMAADDKRVFVATKGGLLTIDFSDPANPRKSAEVSLPLWGFSSVEVAGQEIYLAGQRKEIPIDHAGVVELSLRAPEAQRVASLGPVEQSGWIGSPIVARGHLYVGQGALLTSALRVFDLSVKDAPSQTDLLPIENALDPKATFYGAPRFNMCVRGEYAYLASHQAMFVLSLRNPAHPKLVRRINFDDGSALISGLERQIAYVGDRLYVQGRWPQRLLVYDLLDPLRPSRREEFNWRLPPTARLDSDGTVFVLQPEGVLQFRPQSGYWVSGVRHMRERLGDIPRPRQRTLVATGGYVFILFDGKRLAAFPLPK